MTRTARPRTLAAGCAAMALMLSACSLLPGRGAPELERSDVLTLGTMNAGMFGFFGTSTTEVTGTSVSVRYELPDGTELYALDTELDPSARERLEEAAGQYVAWERSLSPEDRAPCTDLMSTDVAISGSFAHSSSVQDCHEDTPLRTLTDLVDEVEPDQLAELAHPLNTWSVEVTPSSDEAADRAERWVLLPAEHEVGMLLEEPDGSRDGESLGWGPTGDALRAMNAVLLADEAGCEEPLGEVALVEQRGSERRRTVPLCAGQPAEELAEVLRGL